MVIALLFGIVLTRVTRRRTDDPDQIITLVGYVSGYGLFYAAVIVVPSDGLALTFLDNRGPVVYPSVSSALSIYPLHSTSSEESNFLMLETAKSQIFRGIIYRGNCANYRYPWSFTIQNCEVWPHQESELAELRIELLTLWWHNPARVTFSRLEIQKFPP